MKNKVYLTRRECFNAAHKLENPEWTREQNEEVFGACSNPNWHGHNFVMFVTVSGVPDPVTGFVINLKELKKIIREEIIDKVDHRNINLDVDFMMGIMPSVENMAVEFWKRISMRLQTQGFQLYCIKLYETENHYVEYFGE